MASEATDPCGSQVVLKNILFEFMFRFDHQNSSNRAMGRVGGGGGWFSPYISLWKVRGGERYRKKDGHRGIIDGHRRIPARPINRAASYFLAEDDEN
jgi:hypothetical protein